MRTMKHIINTLIVCLLLTGFSYAQEAEKPKRVKLSGKEHRELRAQQEEAYLAWERKYFNSPGKWFINFKAGYGWPLGVIKHEAIVPFEFLGQSELYISENGNISDKLNLSSDGFGPRINLGFGTMFNRFVGFEMELGYIEEIEQTRASINTPTLSTEFTSDLFELYIDPLLVFQSPNMNNFYLYGRLGPHIPIWGRPTARGVVDDREGLLVHGILFDPVADILESIIGLPITQDVLEAVDYHGTLKADSKIYLQQNLKDYSAKEVFRGIGVNASLGFRYQATPIVSVFAEARVMGFNISVAQAIIEDLDSKVTLFGGAVTVLELTEEGGNAMGNPVSKEELKSLLDVIYLNELNEDSNNPVLNPDGFNQFNQRNELAPRLSVLSVGFQVGIQINFSGKDITYRTQK